MKMSSAKLAVPLSITHIGTATALLTINGVTFITDPVFCPAGTEWNEKEYHLETRVDPTLTIVELPPIDAVLLSHEDHPDNLDQLGRKLLDARRVFTTPDGAKNLAPRPGVCALKPWQTVPLDVGNKRFDITGTPCKHLPGGEVVGFIVSGPDFGSTEGKPNAVYFGGDTVYIPELLEMKDKFHIAVALLNLADVHIRLPESEKEYKITMDGKDAAKLVRNIGADVLIPLHYEGWAHFKQSVDDTKKDFRDEGIEGMVRWLQLGVETKLV